MAFENLADVKGFATSDLFIKHPTKNLWKMSVLHFGIPYLSADHIGLCNSVGRVDDVITLASGEKMVPVPMENIVISSPLLQGVVMFGRERNQVGVLVEPRPGHAVDVLDENTVAEFRNEIWSVFLGVFDDVIGMLIVVTGRSSRKRT